MMQTSLFLARIIGPTVALIGLAILLNPQRFRDIAAELMRSPALIFLIGHAALPLGIATVLVHNVWAADWRVIITILGWLGIVGGAVRILAPARAMEAGRNFLQQKQLPLIAGGFWLIVGLILCTFGYVR